MPVVFLPNRRANASRASRGRGAGRGPLRPLHPHRSRPRGNPREVHFPFTSYVACRSKLTPKGCIMVAKQPPALVVLCVADFLWRGLPPPLVVYLWLKLPGCLYSADCREEVFSKTQRAREHKKKGRVKSSALLLESTFFMVRLPPTPHTPVQEPSSYRLIAPPVVLPIPPVCAR